MASWQGFKQSAYKTLYEFDFADSKVMAILFAWNIFEVLYITNYFSKRAAVRAAKMVRYEAREEVRTRRGPKAKKRK